MMRPATQPTTIPIMAPVERWCLARAAAIAAELEAAAATDASEAVDCTEVMEAATDAA